MRCIRLVILMVCVCFASVTWSQQAAGACSNNWSEFHRQNMQRWNPCEEVLGVNNVGYLQLKWSYATGSRVFSSPAVANGVVYIGSEDNILYALKASTGAKLWGHATAGGVDTSPAVANGGLYFGAPAKGNFPGVVLARKGNSGAKLWHYLTDAPPSSATVVNGVVYVAGLDDTLRALNASTGALLWRFNVRCPAE